MHASATLPKQCGDDQEICPPYGSPTRSSAVASHLSLPLEPSGDNVRTRAPKYLLGAAFGAVAATLLIGTSAFAEDEDPVVVLGQQTNLLWVVIGAVLVIFMQAGFALVETGFTQKKNAAHVMSTNFAIFGLGFVGFLFVGFPLAFGGFSYSALRADARR